MSTKFTRSAFLICSLFIGLISLQSCAKNSPQTSLALISFTHASPGLEPIDIYLGGSRINGDSIIAYNDTISYRFINSGTLNVVVKKNISSITYISRNLEIDPGKYYSFFVTGKPDSVTYVVTQDDMTKPASGKVKLRFLNMMPDSGPLDVKLTGNNLFTNQNFKSYTDFASIDPGTYRMEVYRQGGTVPVISQEITLSEGYVVSVWARGLITAAEAGTGPSLGIVSLK